MQDAYRHCEQLVRAADKDRFLASLFAPSDKRDALHALYAFNLEIVRVRAAIRDPMAGEIRLQWWREVLSGERAGEAAANPVAAALLDTIARCALPSAPLVALIEAHAFDLYDDPMPTLEALEAYLGATSAGLIAQAARILVGDHSATAQAARHAGLAHGMTGLLRAVARHASRRQLYVPLDVLDRHGARTEDLFAGSAIAELRAALAEMRIRAGAQREAFEALMPRLPAAAAPAFLPVALVRGDLDRMERRGYDPFRTVIEAPQWRRQWALWRAARRWGRTMRG
jgi:15-cis-phytoene synthase